MIINRVDVEKFKETIEKAKWSAIEGIILKSFKIKATANIDLTRAFGVTENCRY